MLVTYLYMSHYQNFEPPFEIPESWEWVKLENLTSKIGSGSTPKGSNYSEQGIPFFRSQNIYNHGLVFDDIKFISQSINKSMAGTIVQANDLLLNITGGSIGRCAVVPSNFEEGNVSQHVCIIRPILISSEYLHLYILSDLFWKSMKLTGSGREGLPKYNLEKMSLPVPPLGEQHRIVDALKEYNTILTFIEDSSKGILNDIASAKNIILKLAMQGNLVPQDPADEPAAEMLKRINPKAKIITDNPHSRNVPKGWCFTELKSIGKWQSGATPSKLNSNYYGKGYPWLNTGDLNDGIIEFVPKEITALALQETSVKLNPVGSVLIAMYGATIGKLGILSFPSTTNQACCACANCYIFNKFLFFFLLSYRDNFIKLGGGGAQPNISKEKIENTMLLLPPLEEQKRIVAKIEELYSVFDKIEASLQS